jgi:alkaline phosphatase
MCRLLFFLLFVANLMAIPAKKSPSDGHSLRGILLIVSDGTSQELLTAARCYAGGAEGRLVMDDYPATAFVSTYSANDMVTDSAAAATALARGIKADNNVIGMASATSTNSPASLLDIAREAGWSTGTITDDSVTGATPAPFEVECPGRNQHAQIAQMIVPRLGPRADIILGGGNKWFHDMSPTENYASDDLQRVKQTEHELQERPVVAFSRWEDFKAYVNAGNSLKKPVLGTFAPDVLSYSADGTRTLRLKDMVDECLDLMLRDKRPFFLMVEAALPDKACHQNQAKRAIGEVLELDAMMLLLKERLPKDVLVVATTDHNNGGFAFNGPAPRSLRGEALLAESPISKSSTFTWATGPGGPGGPGGARDPGSAGKTKSVTSAPGGTNDSLNPVDPLALDHSQPAAIYRGASQHTGGDVWLVASGPGSQNFHGHIDNTQIYSLLSKAISGEGKRAVGK